MRSLSIGSQTTSIFSLIILVGCYCLFLFPVEILFWWLFTIIGFIFLRSKMHTSRNLFRFLLVYLLSVFFLGIYTFITHSITVLNPGQDIFLTPDSVYFNEVGRNVGSNSWNNFIPYIIGQFLYSDYYLFSFILGVIYKIDAIFGGTDPVLLTKLLNSIVGALTIGFIFLCVNLNQKIPIKSIIWFLLFSPIFENSVVLMRDIYVCFFYAWIFYYVLIPHKKYRHIKILLLCLLSMLIRPENGLFALCFLLIRPIINTTYYSKSKKALMIIFFIIIGTISCIYILPKAYNVMIFYQLRDLSLASTSSFGAMLRTLPLPFNIVLPAIFSQMMPFPLWFNLLRPYGGELTILSIFSSFYWISIWGIIIYCCWCNWAKLISQKKIIIGGLFIAFLYIIMTTYGEINVRRIMGIYPIVFIVYCNIKYYVKFEKRIYIERFLTFMIVILNILYFVIR